MNNTVAFTDKHWTKNWKKQNYVLDSKNFKKKKASNLLNIWKFTK